MERANGGSSLDPAAAEFRPAAERFSAAAPSPQTQVCYPLPLPPPPPAVAVPAPSAAPTRAVVLSAVPRHVAEVDVRAAMEAFGGVQAVDLGALPAEGVVTVHFYDLRSAHAVVAAARDQHAAWQQAGRGFVYVLPPGGGAWVSPWVWFDGCRGVPAAGPPVWAQFAAAGIEEPNQGSISVLNLDAAVSCATLGQIFAAFGAVKQVTEVPSEQQHKLVEFFDKRDAARAMAELNGKEVQGRRMVLQFAGAETQRSISWKRNKSTHHVKLLPPRFVQGSPKAAPFDASPPLSSPSSSASKQAAWPQASNGASSNARKKNCHLNNGASQAPWQQRTRKGWKTNLSKGEGDSRFLFKEGPQPVETSSPSSCRDSRTTVMIRNIPNKYSQKQLLNMLDAHCLKCNEQIGDEDGHEPYSAYDFVYLPIDFNNKCNVGYGFVNMTSPEAAFRVYKAFHQRPWEVFNSRKICQITYARLQGLEALKEHFRSSNLASDNDEYMPAVFLPPRDGRLLTEPVIIRCSPGQKEAAETADAAAAVTALDNAAAVEVEVEAAVA